MRTELNSGYWGAIDVGWACEGYGGRADLTGL